MKHDSSSTTPQCSRIRRRTFLADLGFGATGMALSTLLGRENQAQAAGLTDGPHFTPKAKSVIWVFLSGGYS